VEAFIGGEPVDQLSEPLQPQLKGVTKKNIGGSSRDAHRPLTVNSSVTCVRHTLQKDELSRRRIFKEISYQCRLQPVSKQDRFYSKN